MECSKVPFYSASYTSDIPDTFMYSDDNARAHQAGSIHLDNRQANYQLKMKFNGDTVRHERFPKYLGVYLDRSLTFCRHMASVRNRLLFCVITVQLLFTGLDAKFTMSNSYTQIQWKWSQKHSIYTTVVDLYY